MTRKQVLQLLRYDRETGKIFWKSTSKNRKAVAGHEAGCLVRDHRKLYRRVFLFGKRHHSHRIVWLIEKGRLPRGGLDHIDGDGTNNRIENLREASHSENGRNRSINRNNTSGFTGVYLMKSTGKWYATIKVEGKLKHLGYCESKEEAAKLRLEAQKRLGYSASHGTHSLAFR